MLFLAYLNGRAALVLALLVDGRVAANCPDREGRAPLQAEILGPRCLKYPGPDAVRRKAPLTLVAGAEVRRQLAGPGEE